MAPRKTQFGRNRTAVEESIRALRDAGRLESVDAAKIAAAQSLADAVDADPSNASLWREYRAAELVLRETNDTNTDEFAQLLAALSAEVGDSTQTGAQKPRK